MSHQHKPALTEAQREYLATSVRIASRDKRDRDRYALHQYGIRQKTTDALLEGGFITSGYFCSEDERTHLVAERNDLITSARLAIDGDWRMAYNLLKKASELEDKRMGRGYILTEKGVAEGERTLTEMAAIAS